MQLGSKQDHFHYPTDLRLLIHEETAGMKEVTPSVYQVMTLQNVARNVNKMKNQK
jgi:hypothetical protein